jgi:hypothetical protein
MAPRNQSERAAERRRQKLERVREQLRNGSPTVRQMTPEERARWAPRLASSAASALSSMEAREPSLAELLAVAEHAALRVALYRRRTYLAR